MAAKSYTENVKIKSLNVMEPAFLSDDLEVVDDGSGNTNDEASDENNVDDDEDDDVYLDDLEDFQLKDLDADDLLLFNSRLREEMSTSGASENSAATDINSSKFIFSRGLEVLNSRDEEDDISSDEEQAILKEIRDEIESKVHENITDELNEYREHIEKKEFDDAAWKMPPEKNEEIEFKSQEDLDPRLVEARIKMEKLDKILLKKIRIEKEVKKKRLLLEKRMRAEIAELTKGVKIHQDIKINTERFLALEPPSSHNEGVTLDDEDDFPPLFQTQINDSEITWNTNNDTANNINKKSEPEATTNRTESVLKKSSRSNSSQPKLQTKGRKKNIDFIKRNKELAANADQPFAMTDDEKIRLEELLEGVDELSSPDEATGEDSESKAKSSQVSLLPGEGFCPDSDEMKSLTNIDEKLKSLMTAESYQSLIHSSDAALTSPETQLFSRVGTEMQYVGADLTEKYGDRALFETKDDRELKARLESIEQELGKFKLQNEEGSKEEYYLSDEQLESLLDQCARNLTISTCPESPDFSARSIASSRLSLLENPPILTDEQLQKLLSEAHFPMSSRLQSPLMTDDDEKICEDEESSGAIRAETWKTIKDLDLEAEVVTDDEDLSENRYIDNDLQNDFNTADNISLNVSNNHNKTISTDNNSPHSGQESGEVLSETTSSRYPAFDLIQTSVYSGSVANNLHGTSGGLPRISQSNGVTRSESYLESRSFIGTPMLLPRDITEDAIRLPNISAKSFLVHAKQGMNNAKEKDRTILPPKQPLEILCNDLSDTRADSASSDNEGSKGQGYGCNSLSKTTLGTQPRPPPSKDWQPKV